MDIMDSKFVPNCVGMMVAKSIYMRIVSPNPKTFWSSKKGGDVFQNPTPFVSFYLFLFSCTSSLSLKNWCILLN